MDYVFSWILVSMESASATLLFSSCLEWRPRFCVVGPQIRSPKWRFVCAWLLLTGITFVYANLYQGGIWLKFVISFLLYFICGCLVWQIKWLPMITAPIACITLAHGLDSLMAGLYCTITGNSLQQLLQNDIAFALVGIFTRMLLVMGSVYLRHTLLLTKHAQPKRANWIKMLIVAVVLLLLSLYTINYLLENGVVTMQFSMTILFAIACAVLYMTQSFRSDAAVQLHKKNEQTLLQQNKEQRAILHDTTNVSLTVQLLLEQGKQKQALKLLRQRAKSYGAIPRRIQTGHPIVDVILNDQYAKATEQGIQMQVEVCSLKNLAIQELDVVLLLGNLLDNARNACAQCTDVRRISVLAEQIDDAHVCLTIRNTYVAAPPKQTPNDDPAKAPLHGYGRQNAQKVLRKYNCEYVVKQADGWYRVLTLLPCPIDPQA